MLNGMMSVIYECCPVESESILGILTDDFLLEVFRRGGFHFFRRFLLLRLDLPYLLEKFVEFLVQHINMFDIGYRFRDRLWLR
jgi:hypothetical protein